ncbi:unnamed protein product, partial [Allacma fusca]
MSLYFLFSTFITLPGCIEQFVNSAIDSRKSRRDNKPSAKTVPEIVAIWLPFHIVSVPFVHAFKLALDPHASYSMFAWLMPNWQTPLVLFAFIVLETFWLAQAMNCASLMGFFGIATIGDIQHKGEEGIQRLQMKKDQLWIPARRLQEETQNCRCLVLRIQLFNYIFANTLYLVKLVFITVTIISISFSIRAIHASESILPPIVYLVIGIELVLFYVVIMETAFSVPELVRRYKFKIVHVSRVLHVNDSSGLTRSASSLYVQGFKMAMFTTLERASTPNFVIFVTTKIM